MFRRIFPRSVRYAQIACKPSGSHRRAYKSGRLIPIRHGWPFSDLPANIRQMEKEMSRMFEDLHHSHGMGPGSFLRPWGGKFRAPVTAARGPEVEVKLGAKDFTVKLEVQQYADGELKVKVVDDTIVINGKLLEKPDEHGYVSQEFTRQFRIPEEVDAESIESSISAEGVLTVQGRIKGAENIQEREIPINKETPKETKNDE